jgi:uncharacterized protein YndB with AHSA1/START domain
MDAFSQPELLKRWFGPHGHSLVVCEMDYRVGGSWRFIVRDSTGRDMGMRGKYIEIGPDRTVHVESFDEYPGESTVTAIFTEHDGKTTLTATARYRSQEVRDLVLKSGMERGAAETYDRLAEVLASNSTLA